jgi:hypothetical protein
LKASALQAQIYLLLVKVAKADGTMMGNLMPAWQYKECKYHQVPDDIRQADIRCIRQLLSE